MKPEYEINATRQNKKTPKYAIPNTTILSSGWEDPDEPSSFKSFRRMFLASSSFVIPPSPYSFSLANQRMNIPLWCVHQNIVLWPTPPNTELIIFAPKITTMTNENEMIALRNNTSLMHACYCAWKNHIYHNRIGIFQLQQPFPMLNQTPTRSKNNTQNRKHENLGHFICHSQTLKTFPTLEKTQPINICIHRPQTAYIYNVMRKLHKSRYREKMQTRYSLLISKTDAKDPKTDFVSGNV